MFRGLTSSGGKNALARIVRPRQRFGYDLIAYVGLARYLRKKQREEIRDELFRKRGFKLSAGSVSNLCDRFLLYLEGIWFSESRHARAWLSTAHRCYQRIRQGGAVCLHGRIQKMGALCR